MLGATTKEINIKLNHFQTEVQTTRVGKSTRTQSAVEPTRLDRIRLARPGETYFKRMM